MSKIFDAKGMLRSIGCRVTEGRVALLCLLSKSKAPLTAKDISEKLAGVMDQATLYRALDALTVAGLLRKVHITLSDAVHYELSHDHHHHIVCTKCSSIEELSEEACSAIMKTTLQFSKNFSGLDAHTIELSGLCDSCLKK